MTSALPQTICEIADKAKEKQITILDAPVSGGVPKAENGTLTIMVGGKSQIIEECRPILETMGEKIFLTGEVGSGKAIKMINQVLNAANTYILSEALVLAKHLKIDLETMCTVINESSGGSWVMKNLMPRSILPQNFKPGFKLDLMRKDIGLFVQQAQAVNIFSPMAALVQQVYQAASNQGYGEQYYSIVSQWIQEQNTHLK
jgi:3-hydroxyisobutyrate dehydrogenase-like beta-hydroxyacid dehydrogenase